MLCPVPWSTLYTVVRGKIKTVTCLQEKSAHLAWKKKKKKKLFWKQDEKMTQRNNVGERGEGKPRESWQTTGRFHVWLSADEQTRPSQTRLGARRCHLGQWNQQRGARRMSAPIHYASPCCQRSGAWRHKQRERQKKMRVCGGHPGHGREALEEQRLWGHKRRGENGRTKKRKVAFQKIIWASSSIGTVGMAPEGRPLSGEVC